MSYKIETTTVGCIEEDCKTSFTISGERIEGLRCPRCNGHVVVFHENFIEVSEEVKFVSKEIFWRNHKHCFDLTDKQIETVLEIYKRKPNVNGENKQLLMGSNNHNGWKLEELLCQVKLEVSEKINKVINDPSPQAQLVVRNNLAIIEHLGAAEALQRSSFVVLDAIRANEGPAGTPRIGEING